MNNATHDGDCSGPGFICPPVVAMRELIDNADNLTRAKNSGVASSYSGDASEWGTRNLPEAVSLARNGWPDGAAKLQRLAVGATHGRRNTWAADVAGAFPIVGDYTAGRPDCMRTRRQTRGDNTGNRAVTILYPVNASAVVTGDALTTVGAAMLSVIDALETAGTSVRLIACKHNRDGSGNSHLYRVLVKDHGEHVDLDRLAYALANPSMPRRLFFAWIERASADPRTSKMSRPGEDYGKPPRAQVNVGPDAVLLPRVGDDDTYGYTSRITMGTALAGIRAKLNNAGITTEETP